MASLEFKIEKGIASVSGAEAKGNQTEKGTPYGDSINGGTITAKVDYGYNFFEKAIPVDAVSQKDEMIDLIGVTRGHSYEGVVTR
jgi:large subunit ribosomal protein L3e